MELKSREHAFARDFVFCVMKKWRDNWEPEGVFNVQSNNSPFTDAMKNKILPLVEENRHILQKSFEECFPGALIDETRFKAFALEMMHTYLSRFRMSPETFFFYCLRLSRFAALAVCFYVKEAPYEAVNTIYETIRILQSKFRFTESSWSQLHKYCAGIDSDED